MRRASAVTSQIPNPRLPLSRLAHLKSQISNLKFRLSLLAFALILIFSFAPRHASAAGDPLTQPLAGTWGFKLDPSNQGVDQGWWERPLDDTIKLPGSTDEGKKGPGNTAAPNFDILYRIYPYVGAAWYQREIDIPPSWAGKRVTLYLERCHWETRAWIDDQPAGMQDSLCVPHVHELGPKLAPGKHRLTLRIDNTHKYDMGKDAHSTSDQTQTNWNGAVGKIELRATDPVWIDSLAVGHNTTTSMVIFQVGVMNESGGPVDGEFTIEARCGDHVIGPHIVKVEFDRNGRKDYSVSLKQRSVWAWDEFSPNLYDTTVKLTAGKFASQARATCGFRNLGVTPDKKQFTLNGRTIYLRGTLDCCIYPITGYPPMDVAAWKREIGICQSYGLNHMRFHSWCPPEAAFQAADELGFLFQVELPCWIHNYAEPGQEKRDAFLREEMHRIFAEYGNHPSFAFLSMGNEPGPRDKLEFIHSLVTEAKKLDPRRLYVSGSGWGFGPDDDYHVAPVRGLKGAKTDHDFRESMNAAHNVPLVSHEIGQWTIYPNMEEIKKYTGVVRAKNFEIVRDDLKAKGMLDQAADFTRATGRLMVSLYKEEMEVLMRTPGHAGFQLLDLHDFPGQGTALIGTLDPFWDSKGLIEPADWRRFCGPVVPLLRMPKRVYTIDEPFVATAEVAQFGAADLKDAEPKWRITDEQQNVIAQGDLKKQTLPTGKLSELGKIEASLAKAKAPARLTVSVYIGNDEILNTWNIWVYPGGTGGTGVPARDDIFTATSLDDEAKQKLAAGGRVLLLARGNSRNSLPGSFTPVFWSPVWFKRGAGTMSILCDPGHPALAKFPTAEQTDWQWYDLLTKSRTLILDDLPQTYRPVIQVIDNFSRNHRLGNLLEARVGPGRLMICSIDLATDLAHRPEARQFLTSIQDYMASDAFAPKFALELEAVEKLVAGRSGAPSNIASVRADSAQPDYEADKAADGDPETFWHTAWTPQTSPFPHELVIELVKPMTVSKVSLLPRQDNNKNGYIKTCELYASADGKSWGKPVARGAFKRGADEQTLALPQPIETKYLKLKILAGFDAQQHASLAELKVE